MLGLDPRPARSVAIDIAALAAVGLLLGLAAAQPVFSQVRPTSGRTDAEAIVVFDISRSMLAAAGNVGPDAPRAGARRREAHPRRPARGAGRRLVAHRPAAAAPLPDDERDRVHLDGRPRRSRSSARRPSAGAARATAFGALADLGRQNFFGAEARNRVAFVLTDGESIPFNLGELRAPLLAGRVSLYFVHLWDAEERVYDQRGRQESYRPSPASRSVLDRVAREIGGGVVSEQEVEAARERGTGPSRRRSDRDARSRAPGGPAGAVRRCCGCVTARVGSVATQLLGENARLLLRVPVKRILTSRVFTAGLTLVGAAVLVVGIAAYVQSRPDPSPATNTETYGRDYELPETDDDADGGRPSEGRPDRSRASSSSPPQGVRTSRRPGSSRTPSCGRSAAAPTRSG